MLRVAPFLGPALSLCPGGIPQDARPLVAGFEWPKKKVLKALATHCFGSV